MPLSDDEKQKWLLQNGLDPEKYDVVEEPIGGTPAQAAAPAAAPTMSGPEAFWTGLKRSIVPSGGALAGMAAGARLPLPHPLLRAGATIAGGLLGSYGAGKAQETALQSMESPADYQAGLQQQAAAQSAHPILKQLGEFAPNLLAFGPQNLGVAGKGLSGLLLGNKIAAQEATALAQTGINAAVQGGMDVAQQKLIEQRPEIDWKRAALSTALGGAVSEPWLLGKKMFPAIKPPEAPTAPPQTETPKAPEPVTTSLPDQTQGIANLQQELKAETVAPSAEESPVLEKVKGKAKEFNPLQKYEEFHQPAGEGTQLTPEQLAEAKSFADKRGVKLNEYTGIADATGAPQRGFSQPSERRAGVSSIATADTPYHEVAGHQFFEDLYNSADPADQRIARELLVSRAGDKEAVAEATGKRLAEIKDNKLRSWMQDFVANARRVVGRETPESQLRHFARRAEGDRPFSESPELQGGVPPESAGKTYFAGSNTEGYNAKDPNDKGGFSAVDQLRRVSPKAAQAATEFYENLRKNQGQFVNPAIEATSKLKSPPQDITRYMHEMQMTGNSGVKLAPGDKDILDGTLRRLLVQAHEVQREKGIMVNGREAKDYSTYFPLPTDQKVINTLKTNTPEAAKLKEDFISHQMLHNKEIKALPVEAQRAAAQQLLYDRMRGIANPEIRQSPEYAAVRKAMGVGIPLSWVERNPSKLFSRYFNNVARDFAFYDSIQSKPDVAALYGVKDQFGKPIKSEGVEPILDDNLKTIYKRMVGDHSSSEILFSSVEHMIRGFLLGTATGIRNHISTYAQVLPYVQTKDIPKIVEAFRYIKQGFVDSMELGVNRWHITDLEAQNLGFGYWADKLKAMGDLARKYQGATAIEQWTRAHNMALGELLTQANWGRAAKGDVKAMSWLRDFGVKVDPRTTPISRDAIKDAAAHFVERIQGTYDARGLPKHLLEPSSPLYWMLSLNKWSVEKANTIKKDVIGPAMKGDWGPMIRYATGGALAGAAILQINEMLNNKKNQNPNFKELEVAGSTDDWVYKLAEVEALSGFGGIISDAAKSAGDIYFKKAPRTPGIPSTSFISEDIIGGLGDAMQAIDDGQAAIPVMTHWLLNTVVNNVQALKLAYNQVNTEDNQRKDRYRDLSVYKQLKDLPRNAQGADKPNPYDKEDEKQFKRAKTYEEAQQVMDERIKPRLEGLDKENRKKDIAGLGRNSYAVTPTDPREQRAYLDFVKAAQGEGAATALDQEKRQMDRLNSRKSRLVPRR